ncbi:MAG: hypothetical protein ACE5I1_27295 [bacterium]
MLKTYLLAIFAIPVLMMLWMIVQYAWRKTFSDTVNAEDVLAFRKGCGACSCTEICEKETMQKDAKTSKLIGGETNGKITRL